MAAMKVPALSLIVAVSLISLSAASLYGTTAKPCGQCPVNDCGLRPREFRYTCPNGNVLDRCGCVKSCQCAGCPTFNSNLPCPNGKKTDSRGCPLSECVACRQCPVSDCLLRPREFRYTCPNGNVLDNCGCVKSCQCAGCPTFNISLPCPNGKKMDARGCPLSECIAPVCEFAFDCAAVTCSALTGTAGDSNGCPLRDCPCQGAADCPPVNGCRLDCSASGGYKRDARGCVTCECNTCEFAGDCAAVTCPAEFGVAVGADRCPLRGCPCQGAANCGVVLGCSLDCSTRGGYKLNANNCVTCECNTPLCEFAGDCAAVTCPAQFGTAADGNGCPLRGCPCQGAANCPPVLGGCNLDCSTRGGYGTDANSCVKCQCAQKAGRCPAYSWGRKACTSDYDCPGTSKCCRSYRGSRCNTRRRYR